MSTQLSLAELLNLKSEAEIYDQALSIASTVGLPVTSWSPGDPTRSLFYLEAAVLAALEVVVVGYIQSGFLDYAALPNPDGSANPWLNVLAQQVFGVEVPGATFATSTLTLVNTGGGIYVMGAGDVSFKNSTTGATYTNTAPFNLSGVGTYAAVALVPVTADGPFPGSLGNAGAGEIDTIVSGLNGVTCTNPIAATGVDAQAPQTTVNQCRDKLGSLSPNGPAAAYSYVARNSALTGVTTVTDARTYADSTTGDVTVYVRSASGTVSGGDVTSVQNAIAQWATPLCITPTVLSATAVSVNVTYTLWVYQSSGATQTAIEAAVLLALENFFSARPIGGDVIPPATTGSLYVSMLAAEIGAIYPKDTFRVTVSAPGADVALTNGQVPVLGTVTPTVNLVPVPT
jgi:hypothetical protein